MLLLRENAICRSNLIRLALRVLITSEIIEVLEKKLMQPLIKFPKKERKKELTILSVNGTPLIWCWNWSCNPTKNKSFHVVLLLLRRFAFPLIFFWESSFGQDKTLKNEKYTWSFYFYFLKIYTAVKNKVVFLNGNRMAKWRWREVNFCFVKKIILESKLLKEPDSHRIPK